MKCKIFILSVIFLFSLSITYALDYTIPPNTYSIQSGDIDNDGDNDIVVGHNYEWGFLTFLENIGNGMFAISDTMHSFGSITVYTPCNLDNEGGIEILTNYQDDFGCTVKLLVFYNFDIDNPVYYDSGEILPFGHFSPGDFDGDDDFDLVFSSYGVGYDNLWGVIYNLGNREFSMPVWYVCPNQASNAGFYQLECHDIDDNGYDDIIAYTNEETYLYYSYGNYFELDSLNCYAPNGGMVSEDFDNDNDYDIIITHWPGSTQSHFLIYENAADNQFFLHDVTYNDTWGQPISVDINGDGLDDVVNVGNINGIGIFYNVGNMEFDEAVYESVESYGEDYFRASFSDFDGNGTQDVAIIRYGIEVNNITILYNEGDGNFIEEPVSVDNHQIHIPRYYVSNYPNPFKKETVILYTLPVHVSNPVIEIFNIKGEKIKSLNLGVNNVIWDGTDNYHKTVSSGIYFYQVISDDYMSKTKQMLLLK